MKKQDEGGLVVPPHIADLIREFVSGKIEKHKQLEPEEEFEEAYNRAMKVL